MRIHQLVRVAGIVVAALLCGSASGCDPGGSTAGPTKRFESEGFGITFEYPFALSEKTLRGDGPSGEPDDVVREVTLTDDDFIAVRRDPMQGSSPASGINALQSQVDQLAKVLDPNVGPADPITVGGMPGLEYLDTGAGVEHRFLFFLGRDVLYLVHCRSTEQHRAEIAAACDTVQRTVHAV